jgi:hypothetical protein
MIEVEMSFPERLMMKTYDEDGNVITSWDEEKGYFTDGVELNKSKIIAKYGSTEKSTLNYEMFDETFEVPEGATHFIFNYLTTAPEQKQVNVFENNIGNSILKKANHYTDTIKNELLNGAGSAYDTFKDLEIALDNIIGVGHSLPTEITENSPKIFIVI